MLLRKIMGLVVCAMLIGSAAMAGVPDLQETTASMAYQGTETLSLFCLPNGAGLPFDQAFLPGGNLADATINLVLRDGLGVPIANFPFEDMWIEAADGGLVPCGGNATADFNTNEFGETTWANPLFASGQSSALCLVMINGDQLTSNAGLALNFNSADISADGLVDLTDAGLFTQNLFNTYAYQSDFNNDGVVDVGDAGFMGDGLGGACP